MKSLKLQTDFDELIQAILRGESTDDMVEGVIEFWLHKFGSDKVLHLRSLMGEICIHAGIDMLSVSEERYDLPYQLEFLFVSVIEQAHKLQARGYTVILVEGKLDDTNRERFFKIVKV